MKNLQTIVLLWLFWSTISLGQNPQFSAYGLTYGLQRPDVSCIFLDSRGILWVGTHGAGLYQFGPGRFSQTAVLPENTGYNIRQLGELPDGHLLILSELALLRYDGRDVTPITQNTDPVNRFAVNAAGLWWTAGDSLHLLKKNGIKQSVFSNADLLIPGQAKSAEMHVVSNDAISVIDISLKQIRSIAIAESDKAWQSFTYDIDSTIWIVSSGGMLLHYDGYRSKIVDTGLPNITGIGLGALGSLWISGAHGISIFQPLDSSLIALPVTSPVNCLYFDRFDRLWIGSATEGLIRYYGEQHRTWSLPAEAGSFRLYSGKTTDAALVATPSGALVRVTDQQQDFAPLQRNSVRQIYQDILERKWALTADQLWMYLDTTWTLMDTSASVHDARIVGSDMQGNLWIALVGGLVRYGIKPVAFPAGITFSAKQISGKLPTDKTVTVLTGKNGEVIRVGAQSVGRIENDHYVQTHQMSYNILSADLDSTGYLWLGTQTSGVFRFYPQQGQAPRPLQTTYPLRTADVIFVKHMSNALLIGTDRQLLRMHTDTSNVRVIKVDILNEESGIPFEGLQQDHIAVTADGRVLVIAEDAVIEFELKGDEVVDDVPSVYLQRVLVNGTDLRDLPHAKTLGPFYAQESPPAFAHAENSMTFTFGGSTVDDEVLSYQWRLEGLQDTWTALAPAHEVLFDDLKPGAYSLEVRVCDPAGNCSMLSAPWAFEIRKAIWQQIWFWALIGLGVMGIFVVIHRQRSQRKRIESEREKKRLEAEINALALEQKSLQLQMNPHFIFNALQSVRSHIHEDKLDVARVNLTHFAKLMRMMLEMSRAEKITLDDELEFLQAYVEVEKMSHHLPVHFNLILDENLEEELIQLPPMLIQPILENALKYGGDGKEVKVDMHVKEASKLLHVMIEDNGTGFGTHAPHHKSASLDILKDRLARMGKGGGVEIGKTALGGARVELRIPV